MERRVVPGDAARVRVRDPRFRSGEPAAQPAPPPVPPDLRGEAGSLRGAELVWVKPGTEVWRLGPPERATYLKWAAPGLPADELDAEIARLAWLAPAIGSDAGFRIPAVLATAA